MSVVVGQEGANFFGGGGQAGEVEVDAAEEVGVVAELGRQDLDALPLAGDEFVDLAEGGGFLPGEAVAVAHDGEGGGGVGAFEAGEHGGFTAAEGGDEAQGFGLDDLGVAAFDEGFAGDVADLAVGVGGEDAELLLRADFLDDGIMGEELDGGDAGGVEVEPAPALIQLWMRL